MQEVIGTGAPSERTVVRWIHDFSAGKETFSDLPRTGRIPEVVNERSKSNIKDIVAADARLTIVQISGISSISKSTVQRILTEHLHMRKLCARWVPHHLSEEEKANRVRIASDI